MYCCYNTHCKDEFVVSQHVPAGNLVITTCCWIAYFNLKHGFICQKEGFPIQIQDYLRRMRDYATWFSGGCMPGST